MALTVVLLLSTILCTAPLGLYLILLARLHRSSEVTVWSGRADFLVLLAGISGFLLVCCASWLLAVQSNARYLLRGNGEQIEAIFEQERQAWAATIAILVALIGLPMIATLYKRKNLLAVYNISWAGLERTIDETVTELGISANRFGHVWSDGRALLAAEPSWGSEFCGIRILTHDLRLAEELKITLRNKLTRHKGSEGITGVWFHTAGVTCLAISVAALLLNFYYIYLVRNG